MQVSASWESWEIERGSARRTDNGTAGSYGNFNKIHDFPDIFLDISYKIAYKCFIMRANRRDRINEEVKKIKEELNGIGAMRPGTLSRQYKLPQEKLGSYWQLSYTRKMKSHTEYIRPPFVQEIRQQIAVYKRFKKLVHRWVDLAIEESRLKMKEAKRNP